MSLPRSASLIAAAILFCVDPSAAARAASEQTRRSVELAPTEPPRWTWTRLVAPLAGLFPGGSAYWYAPRVIEVDTDPPGARLELHYVRDNFQKAYERVDAPAKLVLPSRIDAAAGDSVAIRALLDGHRQQELRVAVRSRTERVQVALVPLPNPLLGFSERYFAGRGSLIFSTQEPLAFRLQAAPGGFRVLLLETRAESAARESLGAVESALLGSLTARQIGEDLMLAVTFAPSGRGGLLEPRSRRWRDPLRDLHVLSLDFVPEDDGAAETERIQRVLAGLQPAHATGCALEFEAHLRSELDPAALARALAPDGSYRDRSVRAALRRLAEISEGGFLRLEDGSRLRAEVPLELTAATLQPSSAVGSLAVLRALVHGIEPEPLRRAALRSLLAPQLPATRFAEILDGAEQRERACAKGSPQRAGSLPSG